MMVRQCLAWSHFKSKLLYSSDWNKKSPIWDFSRYLETRKLNSWNQENFKKPQISSWDFSKYHEIFHNLTYDFRKISKIWFPKSISMWKISVIIQILLPIKDTRLGEQVVFIFEFLYLTIFDKLNFWKS